MIHAVVDLLISRRSGGRLNCLAGVGGEDVRGRAENYLELLSNQSRSGSVSSVSLQSKSSTLSSTTSETSSSERRAGSIRGSSSMATSSAVSSPALSSATLASGSSPVLKVSTGRTPSVARRVLRKNQTSRGDEMVTIKCQRLTEDRTFEEIEIEVPAGVYNNIQTPGDLSQCSRNSRERRSFGSRLRSLILKS